MTEREEIEITSEVISADRKGDLVILLVKRPEFEVAKNVVRNTSVLEMMDMGKMMEQVQQSVLRAQTQMSPILDNSVMKLVLTLEEYNKIGCPYIGSKIKMKIAMPECQ